MLVVAGKASEDNSGLRLRRTLKLGRTLSATAKDRVWIAYEQGDEQWGKDYANNNPGKVPVKISAHRSI